MLVSRVRRWLDPPEVTYELQKMSHKGGWVRELGPRDDPEELPDRAAMWGKSGKYRLLKREDGDFAEVVWSFESEDADEYYQRQREVEKLRAETRETVAEVRRELER